MYRYLLFFIGSIFLFSCGPDEEALPQPLPLPDYPELGCEKENFVGDWYVVDSLFYRYLDNDSSELYINYSQINLYEDGSGYFYFDPSWSYTFLWNLRCNPDTLTFTINPSTNGSKYAILSNKQHYKKMRFVHYNNSLNRLYTNTRELLRKP